MKKIYKEIIEDLNEMGLSNFLSKYPQYRISGTFFKEKERRFMAFTYIHMEEGDDYIVANSDIEGEEASYINYIGYGNTIEEAIINLIIEIAQSHIVMGEEDDEE